METTVPTIAETIAQVIPETSPAETVPTQVIEVVETIDYTQILSEIFGKTAEISDLLTLLSGFALFFVVVALCYFCYKFFRIFF